MVPRNNCVGKIVAFLYGKNVCFYFYLGGHVVNLPAPKNHFSKDVCISSDMLVLDRC